MAIECRTPGCTDDAKSVELCSKCYSYIYAWQKKTPAALSKRVNQLDMYQTRMTVMGVPTNIKKARVAPKDMLTVIPGQSRNRLKYKRRKTA